MKPKIVVVKDLKLSSIQTKRLESLGNVTYYKEDPKSADEWLSRCLGADIICTGLFGLNSDKLYSLHDVFISVPAVGVEFLNKQKLVKNNIVVANAPGCNKESVSEWIIGMLLMYFRKLSTLTRATNLSKKETLITNKSLYSKRITILGAGNIGLQLGKICEALGMEVTFFKRGDNLIASIKEADIIANCLSTNDSSIGLLDKKFFSSLKKGSFFISSSRSQTYDINALKDALNKNILIGAADDAASAAIGDVNDLQYKLLLKHPKILVTPHIAWNSDIELKKSNDIMIDNISAWLNKKPINLIK